MVLDATAPFVARFQGGAFTRRQAEADGWSGKQITRRLRQNAWQVVCGDALAVTGDVTVRTRAWAARLTWPDAVVSHVTAAELHRLPVPASTLTHVTVPDAKHRLRGGVVHRLSLVDADVLCPQGQPRLTTPRRTAVDCLRWLTFDEALALWTWLVTRRLLTREDLVAEIAASQGRWGTPQLVRLLAETRGGALSRAERRLHALLRHAGITGWTANETVYVDGVAVAVADVLFDRARLIVEVDGFAAHSSRDAFVKDRRRQNLLLGAGYLVLRFTWADLVERPDTVIQQIRAALAQR